MKKYIFATDVDGTMLMDDGKVHPETLLAFQKAREQGHFVAIATGRSLKRTWPLKELMPYVDFFVCNNGSLVHDVKNDKTIVLHGINPKHYLTMLDLALKNNVVFKMHTDKDWIGFKEHENENCTILTKELNDNIKKHILENPNDTKLFNGQTITQLSLFSLNDFCVNNFSKFKELFSKDCSIYLTNSVYLDLNPKNISKWSGLLELANILNIDKNDIVTFGDSGNDYEMILNAGKNGYALENSHPDLKEKIKPRIGTNNTNAIGLKIFEYLENNK